MSQFRHFKAVYLHESARTRRAARDTVNPRYYVNIEIIPGLDELHVSRQVREMGGIPVRIAPKRISAGRVPQDYRVNFLLALHFGVQSGQSAGAVLEGLIEAETWPLREQLDPAVRVLKAGASFSDAMSIMGIYDVTTLAILEAGEQSGTLPQSIEAAVAHLERKGGSDALLKGGAVAIGIDLMVIVSSLASTRFGSLPMTKKQGFKSDDPAMIEAWNRALDIAFIGNDILLIISAGFVAGVLWLWWQYRVGTPEVRRRIDAGLLRVPYLGQALLDSAIAASTGVMGHLLRGGVMFLQAAEIAARSVQVSLMRDYWQDSIKQVSAGQPVGSVLAREPMSRSEQQVLTSQKSQPQLAAAFKQIGEYRQQQSERSKKKFIFAGVAVSFMFSGIGIALQLYINWIQIKGVMSSSGV